MQTRHNRACWQQWQQQQREKAKALQIVGGVSIKTPKT
jgi:hypothetical protein